MNLIDQLAADLALRTPQKAALLRLDATLGGIPDLHAPLAEVEASVAVGGFERFDTAFPSFCFHIATAVGKTRLMGAAIAYLYHTRGWRNFFILTKGSTIYQKTIDNFTRGNPKYVLAGYTDLPEAALITGENYERAVVGDRLQAARLPFLGEFINLFVFNVEKIFDNPTEQRRFRAFNETLGGSLADLLAAQPDLVLLMDESHRYRAAASMAALNALRPMLGLEFTATPAGKNTIYRYDLGQAIRDTLAHLDEPVNPSGFIKVPVVLGRRDLHLAASDAFEEVQLQDGIARHRRKKTALEAYCRNHDLPPLLPIALLSTRNIAHAEAVRARVESDAFFGGEYRGKTVVTHSKTGDLREEDITGLLALESPANDKEIVIHVNKLREGWDVKNVYTIIPLRAAKSDVLTEQTIGRGLRLPFGVQTGDEDLDTLEIAAHDHFAAIVREAHANQAKTGVPVRSKEVTARERAETEIRTVAPVAGSPFRIDVPKLTPAYRSEGRLADFDIAPRRAFDSVINELIGTTLGGSQQRVFDVPPYAMTEEPSGYLLRVIFDKCESISTSDPNDLTLVPQLVRRYLLKIDTAPSTWTGYVQAHAAEMVADLVEQIEEHVVEHTEVRWQPAGEVLAWREWTKSVPTGYVSPPFTDAPDAECTKCLLTGYARTIYPEAQFDSKQEKWLADMLERDPAVRAWVRVPVHQFPIFYAAGDYNPDFLAATGEGVYLLEVKSAAELEDKNVRRKAVAALAWCAAASEHTGRRWRYRLLPHDSIQPTDSFAGVLSRAYVLPNIDDAGAEDRADLEDARAALTEGEAHGAVPREAGKAHSGRSSPLTPPRAAPATAMPRRAGPRSARRGRRARGRG